MKSIQEIQKARLEIDGARSEESYDSVEGGFDFRTLRVGSFGRQSIDSEDDWWLEDREQLIQIIPDADWDSLSLPIGTVQAIEARVRRRGMDALAWYVSFHTCCADWGVHIPVSGIAYVAAKAFASLNTPMATKVNLAFQALLHHELFHFATDYAMAQTELILREPWWIPARRAFAQRPRGYCELDERLANAYMLQAFRKLPRPLSVSGKQQALVDFTRQQPAGYDRAADVSPYAWATLLDELADEYRQSSQSGFRNNLLKPRTSYDWEAQFPIRPKVDWRNCPIYLIDDSRTCNLPNGSLLFFTHLSVIDESSGFLDRLRKLDRATQNKWNKKKDQWRDGLTVGADFKKWTPGGEDVYSVRVDRDVRAHLRYDRQSKRFTALEIGRHKEMGHG